MPMSKADLIEGIRQAFAGTPRPDPPDFVCEQCELFLGCFLKACPATWEEIRSEDISKESSALTAVTPRGWRFLLPAYMVWHLQHYDRQTSSNTVDYLIYNLTWSENKDDHILGGFRSLSPKQMRVVDAFLAFIAAQTYDDILAEDAAKARASYWKDAAA